MKLNISIDIDYKHPPNSAQLKKLLIHIKWYFENAFPPPGTEEIPFQEIGPVKISRVLVDDKE